MVGDAASDGTPNFAKWSVTEYRDALNFAITSQRKQFAIPYGGQITWVGDQYNYALPDADLVYIHTIRAESNSAAGFGQPVVGSGLFEYWVPLELVTPQRMTEGSMTLHFDKRESQAHGLNASGLDLQIEGYVFQHQLTASADECKIPYDALLIGAKNYLHMSAMGRDPNQLMQHYRQWQMAVTEITGHDGEEIIEVPGGIWLDGR